MTDRTSQSARSFAVKANLWLLSATRRWLRIALVILTIYVSLPFVAPALMKLGAESPARVLYRVYSPFCHQFAFRSFFLFGEQSVYPRANTGTSLRPFESYATELPDFKGVNFDQFDLPLISSARRFVGNEQMGYKIALCERDITIYSALLLGGLIYAIPNVRRRLRPVPIWLYVVLGLTPIGLDGLSQMLGYPPFNFWPVRETLPIFRVITGGLFGFMNAWLFFPHMELAMRDTRRQIEYKLYRAGVEF